MDEKDCLEPGWRRVASHQALPTFTTSRPSPVPGRKPAGLELCSEEDLGRWKQDMHRFPPYQYKAVNCVTNGDRVRVPSVRERECILGFPLDYTARCYPKSQQNSTAWTDCRLTLLGNSWSVPVVCYLLHSLFLTLGLNTPLTMQDLVRPLTPEEEDNLSSLPPCDALHNWEVQAKVWCESFWDRFRLRGKICCFRWVVTFRQSQGNFGAGVRLQVGSGQVQLSTSMCSNFGL